MKVSDLVKRMKDTISQQDSKPSDDQYRLAVIEAIRDLGERAPATKMVFINIVAGTSVYALPTDFVKLQEFPQLSRFAQQGVIVTSGGLIPLSNLYTERYSTRNFKLSIFPVPTYSLNRPLWYGAGYVLDTGDNDTFTDLTDLEAGIGMHKASALLLLQIADGVARQAWRYSLGDETVDKIQLAFELRKQATAEADFYKDALADRNQQILRQATYATYEYGSFAQDIRR